MPTTAEIAAAFGVPGYAGADAADQPTAVSLSLAPFLRRCEQAKHDALRGPLLSDEEKAAYLSAVAAVAARDEAQRAPQGDLLEGGQG